MGNVSCASTTHGASVPGSGPATGNSIPAGAPGPRALGSGFYRGPALQRVPWAARLGESLYHGRQDGGRRGQHLRQRGAVPSRHPPGPPAGSVGRQRYRRLAEAIREILGNAIAVGGTTLRDFTDSSGNPGYFRQSLTVYGRGRALQDLWHTAEGPRHCPAQHGFLRSVPALTIGLKNRQFGP